jgi:membrane protease subunit HflC
LEDCGFIERAGDFGVRFLRTVGSNAGAQSRVDERVRSILGDELGRVNMTDLVSERGSQGPHSRTAIESLSDRVAQRVRSELQGGGSANAQRSSQDFGIEVVDVRLKRFNLPEENRTAVYDRMRSERKRIAVEYRSQGEAEASKIRSQADLEREQALASAYAEAQRIRGEGEARATEIYGTAHSQDPEFYQLLRTLDAYKQILNDKTTLVLSAGSSMMRLLNEGLPQVQESPPPTVSPATAKEPAETPAVARDGQSPSANEGATP